ncbi:hypothetical protein HDU99_008612 [Rhizoclosmatium hyalinum]|nr:hypothetical protein HDU99_008612 [Rhizoclosmatium hyalinum]
MLSATANDTIIKLPNIDTREQLALGQGFDLNALAPVQYNILPSDFKQTQVQTVEWSDTFFTANESSDEKMNKFGLGGFLKVGAYFGLINPGGEFEFLRTGQSKTDTVRGVLMYRYEIEQEFVTIDHALHLLDATKILKEDTDATHIVTKIVYGGYASCTFDRELKDDETVFEIEAKLGASLKNVIDLCEVKGNAEFASDTHSFLSNTKMAIQGSFVQGKKIPVSAQEVVDHFRSIPAGINKKSKNHARYELTSLDTIRHKLNTTYKSVAAVSVIDEETSSRILNSVDRVVNSLRKVSEELRIVKLSKHKDLLPLKEFEASAQNLDENLAKLHRRIKRCLKDREFENADVEMLAEEPKITSKSEKLVKSIQSRVKFINFIINDMYPGVDVLPSADEVDIHCKSHIVLKTMNGSVINDIHPYEFEKECKALVSPLLRVAKHALHVHPSLFVGGVKTVVKLSNLTRMTFYEPGVVHDWAPCRKDTTLADVNVLLVGASGIGKSTLINGIANYMAFDDFEDVMQNSSELIIPIPGRFIANGFGRRNSEGEIIREDKSVVLFGDLTKNSNENVNDKGQSVTQYCKKYTISVNNRRINFIDTPGMLDSRGIEQDQKNSDHIIAYISTLTHLSAVLFVMKPNEERLTANIKYTFEETFGRLRRGE